mgnify:CR=1 FL=1
MLVPRMNRAISILLILIVISLPIYSIVYSIDEDEIRGRVAELYVRVYQLGRDGINVSHVISELNMIVGYIDEGRYDDALRLLDKVSNEVSSLEEVSNEIIFWSNFYKYSTVAILVSIPIMSYLLIPRIYTEIWFRLRRRWIVSK